MKTESMSQTEFNNIVRINGVLKRESEMRSKLESVRQTLASCVSMLHKSERVIQSGWYVLLSKKGCGWICVGVVNPDNQSDDTIPEEFDMCLPIPEPHTIPEFDGF